MGLVVERLGWGEIVEKRREGDGVGCRETWLGGKRRTIYGKESKQNGKGGLRKKERYRMKRTALE